MIELKIVELKGKIAKLKKLSNLPNGKSKVPLSKETSIMVSENLIIGYPLMKKRVSRHRDEAPRSVPATSTVIKILEISEGNKIVKFRTENSVYQLTVA